MTTRNGGTMSSESVGTSAGATPWPRSPRAAAGRRAAPPPRPPPREALGARGPSPRRRGAGLRDGEAVGAVVHEPDAQRRGLAAGLLEERPVGGGRVVPGPRVRAAEDVEHRGGVGHRPGHRALDDAAEPALRAPRDAPA